MLGLCAIVGEGGQGASCRLGGGRFAATISIISSCVELGGGVKDSEPHQATYDGPTVAFIHNSNGQYSVRLMKENSRVTD